MNLANTARIALCLVLALALCAVVYVRTLQNGLRDLAQTGAVRVEQTSDRLLGQIEGFRKVIHLMARHPTAEAAARGDLSPDDVRDWLRSGALTNGADVLSLVRLDGSLIATSAPGRSVPGASSPLLAAVRGGRLGFDHILEDGQRKLLFARGLRDLDAAVVLAIDVTQLEIEWRIEEEAVAFFDADGVVFMSNRPGLALRHLPPDDLAPTPDFSRGLFYEHQVSRVFGASVWRFSEQSSLPPASLVQTRFLPQIQMTARVFMSVRPVERSAAQVAGIAGLLVAFFGLVAFTIWQARKRMSERLAFEEAAKTRLEVCVEERTRELRQAQEELVQASKLNALGQMSAGISHELSQPLATIRNYADNAQKLLDRGDGAAVHGNLQEISGQVARVDRIIRHLRGFARGETEAPTSVALRDVVADAVEMTEARFAEVGADVSVDVPPINVHAGRVRLGQVLVNILSNAADAVEGQAERTITVTGHVADHVVLTVADTGSGLADPSRVFDPFYTTKDIGAAKGLGLGLSISHGMIASFGGSIRADNGPDGAVFTLRLTPGDQA